MTDDLFKSAEEAANALHKVATIGGYPNIPSLLMREGSTVITALIERVKELEAEVDGAHAIIAAERAEMLALRDRVKELEARAEKAEAALALRVEVKPLEWEDFDGRGAAAVAMLCVKYLITKWSSGKFEVSVSAPGYGTGFDGERWHPTIEAAKAAAQADYEARIRSVLVVTPDVARVAKAAAQAAADWTNGDYGMSEAAAAELGIFGFVQLAALREGKDATPQA